MDNIARGLTRKKMLSESEIVQKIRWAQALEACEQYHNDMLECKRNTIFGVCTKESNLFWECMDAAFAPGKLPVSSKKSS